MNNGKFSEVLLNFIIYRSARKSGSLLCLWYLRWLDFPALLVWSTLHSGEGCQRACIWSENRAETAKRIYGRPLWGWHLRLLILPLPHTISPHNGRLHTIDFDCRTGSAWGGTDENCVQRRHLATSWLRPLCHSQNESIWQLKKPPNALSDS